MKWIVIRFDPCTPNYYDFLSTTLSFSVDTGTGRMARASTRYQCYIWKMKITMPLLDIYINNFKIITIEEPPYNWGHTRTCIS